MPQSIYQVILQNLTAEGVLPEDFSLFGLVPTGDPYARDGARDAITFYHGIKKRPVDDSLFRMFSDFAAGNMERAVATLETFTKSYTIADYLDQLADGINTLLAEGNPYPFVNYMIHLLSSSANPEVIKFALLALENISLERKPEVKEVIRTLALADEFSFYCSLVVANWTFSDRELFDMAKKVSAWGRQLVVPRLEMRDPEVNRWLLEEGHKSNACPEYQATFILSESMLPTILQDPDLDEEHFLLYSNIFLTSLETFPMLVTYEDLHTELQVELAKSWLDRVEDFPLSAVVCEIILRLGDYFQYQVMLMDHWAGVDEVDLDEEDLSEEDLAESEIGESELGESELGEEGLTDSELGEELSRKAELLGMDRSEVEFVELTPRKGALGDVDRSEGDIGVGDLSEGDLGEADLSLFSQPSSMDQLQENRERVDELSARLDSMIDVQLYLSIISAEQGEEKLMMIQDFLGMSVRPRDMLDRIKEEPSEHKKSIRFIAEHPDGNKPALRYFIHNLPLNKLAAGPLAKRTQRSLTRDEEVLVELLVSLRSSPGEGIELLLAGLQSSSGSCRLSAVMTLRVWIGTMNVHLDGLHEDLKRLIQVLAKLEPVGPVRYYLNDILAASAEIERAAGV